MDSPENNKEAFKILEKYCQKRGLLFPGHSEELPSGLRTPQPLFSPGLTASRFLFNLEQRSLSPTTTPVEPDAPEIGGDEEK